MTIPASELAALSEFDREDFLDTLESWGTGARLQQAGMSHYVGPADVTLTGVIFGYRLARPDSSISADVWFFESDEYMSRAHAKLSQAAKPEVRLASNGSFLVRFTALRPEAIEALPDCVQAIAGEE